MDITSYKLHCATYGQSSILAFILGFASPLYLLDTKELGRIKIGK